MTDVDLPARFSEEFQGAEWLDDASGPAPGARFKGRNKHPAIGEWETTSIVVACERDQAFGWAIGDPNHPSAAWRFDLTPDGGVGTVLRYSCVFGPGPSGLSAAIERMPDKEERIIERRCEEHRANMQRVLDGIKQLAES